MVNRIPEGKNFFTTDIPNLYSEISNSHRPKGYEQSAGYSKTYDLAKLPSEEILISDLNYILDLYAKLTFRGGIESNLGPDDYSSDNHDDLKLDEKRKYKLHRVIERNSNHGKKIKRIKGYTCEACGFNFEKNYGKVGEKYIEAHLKIPISSLPEDQIIEFNLDDYAVLCSNCHRMAHKRRGNPYSIEELKSFLKNNNN